MASGNHRDELRKQTLEVTALFLRRAADAIRDAQQVSEILPGTARDVKVRQDIQFLLTATETATRIAADYAQAIVLGEDAAA